MLFVSLTRGENYAEQTEVGISSLIDTWLLLREMEVMESEIADSTSLSRGEWHIRTKFGSSY